MKLFRKEEGFTLVELMVVVLIIGILVAIAIPMFNVARARAQERSCFANQRTIEGAATTWVADDVGNAIGDLDGDVALSALVADGDADGRGDYIAEAPVCPTANGGYDLTGGVVACTDGSHGHY